MSDSRVLWALQALACSPDSRLSPVQVQKALFLVGQELATSVDRDFYSFKPYHYGPFDPAIYNDLDYLASNGYVKKVLSDRYGGREFEITALGKLFVTNHSIIEGASVTYIERIVAWMRPLSFSQLVSAVYKAYPQWRQRSIFRG